MKKVLLAISVLVFFACAKKKESVEIEPIPQVINDMDTYAKYMLQQETDYKKTTIIAKTRSMEANELLEKFKDAMSQDFAQYDSLVKNANDELFKGNPDKALEIIEQALDEIELFRSFILTDDSVRIHRFFHNIVEEGYYWKIIHGDSKQKIYPLPKSFFNSYFTYGSTLIDLKRYDEAKIALLKALKINPINTDVLFELGEISKHYKNWEELFRLTQEAHKVSYTKEKLARGYRNFGYYFIEQEKFDEAIAMYYASLFFDRTQTKMAISQLDYIKKLTKKQIIQPEEEERLSVFKKNNIKFGVDENLFKTIGALGRVLEEKKEYDKAKFCYEVLFKLTDLEEFKELIEKMPK